MIWRKWCSLVRLLAWWHRSLSLLFTACWFAIIIINFLTFVVSVLCVAVCHSRILVAVYITRTALSWFATLTRWMLIMTHLKMSWMMMTVNISTVPFVCFASALLFFACNCLCFTWTFTTLCMLLAVNNASFNRKIGRRTTPAVTKALPQVFHGPWMTLKRSSKVKDNSIFWTSEVDFLFSTPL